MNSMTFPGIVRFATVCPYCGRINDRHGMFELRRPPEDGDGTICGDGCGGLAVYDHTALGRLRKPTPEERAELEKEPTYALAHQEFLRRKARRERR